MPCCLPLERFSTRTGVLREDSKTWTYGYNNKNEVESGVKKFSDTTNMPGHSFGFAYDSIGNRDSVALDGTTYEYGAANSLNQLTTRVVPSSYTILGSAEEDAKVIVNNRLADRKGEFWYKALTVDNDSSAAYLPVTIKGKLLGAGGSGEDVVAQQTGNLLVPETPETFTYNDDGNLTEDGLWSYTWDGENRLIQIQSASGVPVAAKKKLTFAYDSQSRRIQKKVYTWNSGTSEYDLQATSNFVSDGWNLAAETDGSGAATKTFAWGLDLSGSQQGAGGVGGLLVFRDVVGSKNYYAYADGNGNVSKLIGSITGSIAAEYEYSPFGEVLMQVGDTINPIQWSSKYADPETDLSYYGYRFYSPVVGGWITRDPLEEEGGLNLYGMIKNDAINGIDVLGQARKTVVYNNRFTAYLEWFPNLQTGEIKILDKGAEVMRFRYNPSAGTVQQILNHGGRPLAGISASAMKKIAPEITKSLELIIKRTGNGGWVLSLIRPNAPAAGAGVGLKGLFGRALIFLGSVQVTTFLFAIEPTTMGNSMIDSSVIRHFDASDSIFQVLEQEGVIPHIKENPNPADLEAVKKESQMGSCKIELQAKAKANLNR